MLTDAELKLITAATDGELSLAEERRFVALIAANPSAQVVADQLRGTSARLRQLPIHRAPAGMVAAVLSRLSPTTPARPRRARSPLWLPYAVAASLLFTVSAASYWFFTAEESLGSRTARVRQTLPNISAAPTALPRQPLPESGVAVAPPERDVLPWPREVAVTAAPPPRDIAPMPRPHAGDLIGAGIAEPIKPLQSADLTLPFLKDVREFERDDIRARFAADFANHPAVRIDLFAGHLPHALDAVTAAAKSAGVVITTDHIARERINKKVPTAYALFVEGLTPDELAGLLAVVAKKVADAPQPAVGTVHAYSAGAVEQREWKDLFGRDLGLFRSPRVDPKSPARPISDGTIGKLKQAVGRHPAKAGLLLTYWPIPARTAPQLSKETQAFLAGRGERKPGTLPALLVLRPAVK